MKTIGLIGGMSWESTAVYYRLLNEIVRERLGGLHSAELLLWSFDFHEVEACQAAGRWDEATALMVAAARRLEAGGAEILVIATNTMHKMAEEVQSAVSIPLLHIADATAAPIKGAGLGRVGLLATAYTMEQDFYRGRLEARHGLEVLVPDAAGRKAVHDIIYDELCRGVVRPESKARYQEVVSDLLAEGAEGIVLGCTEVGLLIGAGDVAAPVFDSTRLHAEAAVELALA
jgi:aspartate racemase